MQELVNAVRSPSATNPILLGGLTYSQDLSRMRGSLPDGSGILPADSANQLVASFHPYPGNPCAWADHACLQAQIGAVMPAMPLVAGEVGGGDGPHTHGTRLPD